MPVAVLGLRREVARKFASPLAWQSLIRRENDAIEPARGLTLKQNYAPCFRAGNHRIRQAGAPRRCRCATSNGSVRFGIGGAEDFGYIQRAAMTSARQEPPSGLLVLGYGNTLRRDDGVGPRVAEAVAALALPGVRALACPLLTPELADPISRAHVTIFVDAAVDAPREVQLRKLAPADTSQIMAHAASPATLLALARDVFGHAPEAWLLTIPAENIGIGEELSAFTSRGLETAIEEIKKLARSGRAPSAPQSS